MEVMDIIAIVLIAAGIGAFIYLLPKLSTLIPQIEQWLKTHTTAEQRDVLIQVADMVVDAAEQIFSKVAKSGEQKKAYAMDLLAKLMPYVDEVIRDAAIENSVYNMNQKKGA